MTYLQSLFILLRCFLFTIFFSLQILEAEPLQPETFTVDWNALPELVHPLGGELPLKRLEKKCQQLENLAAAVLSIYQKGDIIGTTICAVFKQFLECSNFFVLFS